MLRDLQTKEFQATVWDYYASHRRDMPWRHDPNPYFVLVSELMLQQTQVSRVIPKFLTFTERFPTVETLALAPLGEVLALWSGLGYNRRAKFLWQSAQVVMAEYDGEIPNDATQLTRLPGVGVNTAGAILAYAFNQPAVFIETNIRTVLLHHFFANEISPVSDTVLRECASLVMNAEHPRDWYWAMMDYGSFLKRSGAGRLDLSAQHRKQSPLKGSLREMRGNIIAALVGGNLANSTLQTIVNADERYESALEALIREGLVTRQGDDLGLTGA